MNSKSIEEAAMEYAETWNFDDGTSEFDIKWIAFKRGAEWQKAQEQKPVEDAVDDLLRAMEQDDENNKDCYWANHPIMDYLTGIKNGAWMSAFHKESAQEQKPVGENKYRSVLEFLDRKIRERFHTNSDLAYELMSDETKEWIDKIKEVLDEQPQQPLTDAEIEALAEKEYPNWFTEFWEGRQYRAFIKGYKAALNK